MSAADKGFVLWFTGLPCSGKTSLSNALETELRAAGHNTELLDGDVVRKGLSKDLGFSKEDRMANIERITFVASLLQRNGVATLVSFVTPYREMRDMARSRIQEFIEVYVRCPLEVCEKRDVKGMYALARQGKIQNFTGVSDPYEEPLSPEITVDTDRMDLAACREKILGYLDSRGLLFPRNPFASSEFLTRVYRFAAKAHRGQTRKYSETPYLGHPVAVAKILKEAGYAEEVIAAGLLHDVLEDTGCDREELEKVAGKPVAEIVSQVTDRDKTADWRQRKEMYLAHLSKASKEALAVCCADKIHNIASMTEGYGCAGKRFESAFSNKLSEKLDNYRRIYDTVLSRDPSCCLLPLYKNTLEQFSRVLSS